MTKITSLIAGDSRTFPKRKRIAYMKTAYRLIIFTLVFGSLVFARNGKGNPKFVSVDKSIKGYQKIINKYNIKSIEDPFAENDWTSWNKIMKSVNNVQIVGDDLYVTNLERLKKGFLNNSSNAILIKLNQIGTVSETLDVIRFAQIIGYKTIISHRSGDSEDTFISDLAVGTNSNQIKTGSLARSERVAKYNQLIRIEEDLGKKAKMNKIH